MLDLTLNPKLFTGISSAIDSTVHLVLLIKQKNVAKHILHLICSKGSLSNNIPETEIAKCYVISLRRFL